MLRAVLFGTLFVLLSSCSSTTETDRDGNLGYRYTVNCRNEVQDCYNRCTELCPDGYLVTNRVRARRVDEHNSEYSVIIRCKQKLLKP
ncbi:MAG: hypothetical protein IT287_02425 [Bdellovibrionaceae bacterium]|nr:hypothetical protein [Pseudobdellovibrionaceae bacterium]